MKEELQLKLMEILSGIQEGVKTAGSFAMEQLPDIAHQFVLYNRAYHTMWVVLGLLVLVLMVACYIKLAYLLKQPLARGEEDAIFSGFVATTLFGGVLAAVCFVGSLDKFFMSWFAPKVFLLTELVKMVK
jgi:hypothetical protein